MNVLVEASADVHEGVENFKLKKYNIMKKINLNQLSMSWNEKQTPQKFRRYAGMLIMLLTLGVGQM